MKRLPVLKCTLLFLCCLCLVGCWDSLEMEKRTLAVAIAVDRDKNDFLVSLQVPNPRKIAGGGESGGGGEGGPDSIQIFQGRGKTISEAIQEIHHKSNFPIFFGHAQTLFVGEELAKEGIEPIIDFFRRNPQIRRQMWPIVIKGKAASALETHVVLEPIPTYYLRDLIEVDTRSHSLPETSLGDVLVDMATPWREAPLFHYISADKDQFTWLGMAVFKRDKMVGVIKGQEVNTLIHIRDGKRGNGMIAPCQGNGYVVFRPKKIERKIVVNKEPAIHVYIRLKGDIEEKTCNLNAIKEKDYEKLNKMIVSHYEKVAKTAIEKAKNTIGVDYFHFEDYLHAFYTSDWKKLDWNKDFKRIPIYVHYSVKVERIGTEAR